MPRLFVYSRRGCHLCDVLIEELLPMVRGRIDVEVRDIDAREEWRSAYDTRVPVVEFGDRILCEYHLDREEISAILAAQS
jgi:hypothetical protein